MTCYKLDEDEGEADTHHQGPAITPTAASRNPRAERPWSTLEPVFSAGKAVPKSKAAGAAASEGELLPFQAVVDKLHERMPPAKLSELSISYCFYCVLDLANKKGLEIVAGEFGDLESLSVRLPAMAKGK